MTENPISYIFSCLFVLLTHAAMLVNVFVNGNYDSMNDVFMLCGAVAALDLLYFIVMPTFRQMTYTINFILILVLNMSVIFKSCFGGVHLDIKHLITCVAALIGCRIGYLVCRDHNWLVKHKKFYYIGILVLMAAIVALTGSRSIWIELGPITIQPSEFIKPLFILACATSVVEQQQKHKILFFNVVYENLFLFGIMAAICLLQWWCRDLGSLPTFMGIYASGFLLRICYPKAKFSKKTLITAAIAVAGIALLAMKFAPAYVQERLHVDIWSDKDGSGYQQSQALIGIARGGWLGRGPGFGYLCNIFAHDNDIVFSTISEEWGLLISLMAVFMLILMVTMPIINPPRTYFHGTMTAGVCAAFTVQMALNIFGSCNLIPFTGVTLPFISVGGSSMLSSGFMIGMLTASQSPIFRIQTNDKKPGILLGRRRSA